MLYIVSTPIGNLKDITLRALEVRKVIAFVTDAETPEICDQVHKHFLSYIK